MALSKAPKGLGRGLSALIPDSPPEEQVTSTEAGTPVELKIIDVEPNREQPRKKFGEDELAALSSSIAEYGVIQPIVVKKMPDGRYQIIAGERRWRAARMAGIKTIPAVIRNSDDSDTMEVALIENLQREDLNPIEEAVAYEKLMQEHGITQDELSKRMGKSRSALTNTLRLLTLDKELQELLIQKKLSSGHARALLAIEDPSRRKAAAEMIIKNNLSVREAEALSKAKEPVTKPLQKKEDVHLNYLEEKIASRLGTKVKIRSSGKAKRIEINYYTNEDLEKILKILEIKY